MIHQFWSKWPETKPQWLILVHITSNFVPKTHFFELRCPSTHYLANCRSNRSTALVFIFTKQCLWKQLIFFYWMGNWQSRKACVTQRIPCIEQWKMFEFGGFSWVVFGRIRFLLLPPCCPVPMKGPPRQLSHDPWPTGHGPWQSWLGTGPSLERDVLSSPAGNSRVTVDCGKAFLLLWNGGSKKIHYHGHPNCLNSVHLGKQQASIWVLLSHNLSLVFLMQN